ncbi:MAG: hypothetical protein ABI411_07935 [Tahibacter sp.]
MNLPLADLPPTQRRDVPLILVGLATAAYAAIAFATMLIVAPRVPYADQWRFYARLITQSFPANVLAADNGHREVLPNLLRVAELRWFDADQSLQIAVGALLALLCVACLARASWCDSVPRHARVAAVFFATLGVVWLGNERALAHANESVHAYLVIACLLAGLRLVARETASESARSALAAAFGLAAAFSFGSGMACLPAFLGVLWLRRAPWRAWAPILAGLVLALLLYTRGGGGTETLHMDPFVQSVICLRWLAAPLQYLLWPLLDTHAAAQLPAGILRAVGMTIAQTWSGMFGEMTQAVWPQSVLGITGVVLFALACQRARRAACAGASGLRIALGVAGFSLLVGGMVAVSRSDYFVALPEQVLAARYLVWSSLFWSGLLCAWCLATPARRRARAPLQIALVVAVFVAPSEVWMGRLALSMRNAAEQVALGAAVGVLDRDEPMGETPFDELQRALPLLEEHGAAMYAWPEARWLGKRPPANRLQSVEARNLKVRPAMNQLANNGIVVEMLANAGAARMLILDAQGRVVGIAQHHAPSGSDAWRGMARGDAEMALAFATLR